MSKAAVIVLSYNSLEETTKPCLESIFAAQTAADFEVLVVDNASTDGTSDYLLGMQTQHANLKLVFNDENLGFAAGNNAGIRAADADFFVLLNSDTIVTDHWLDDMLAFAANHPEVGLLGPVTNSVYNEQLLRLGVEGDDAVIEAGLRFAQHQKNTWFYSTMLGFFCVMVRRAVFDKIGLLDEKFGLGFFEDDDLCLRAREAGFKLACLQSVFIFHRGGACFGRLELIELFCKNRRYFEQKHARKWRTSFRVGVFLDLLESEVSKIAAQNPDQFLAMLANTFKVMRAFDQECFDHPVNADVDNDFLETVEAKKLQLQVCREEKQTLREEIRSQQDIIRSQSTDLETQFNNYLKLKKQYEDMLGRLDWRLLMRINRLPGVAAIKKMLRPLAERFITGGKKS